MAAFFVSESVDLYRLLNKSANKFVFSEKSAVYLSGNSKQNKNLAR